MAANGEPLRPKRRQSTSPVAAVARLKKQLKQDNGVPTPGDGTPRNGSVYDVGAPEKDGVSAATSLAPAGDSPEWQATIERVIKSVVSIHFCQTCSFDTDLSTSSQATGFVVDAERGYILTNRHCDVRPVYRDPVHDFGILQFDPSAIKYMAVTALKLQPESARVGVEVRVVGNDAGEKLSILSGVISRLDRNAPEYGEGYCDFNTNYIQAAAAATGGSSGSPVVNVSGHAVALQAGGRVDGAATDYFLPLDRPWRALQCLQSGAPITRGTIQTQWMLKPFDDCRRLGLTANWESEFRTAAPTENSLLVAEIVLPEGPADGKIAEGDILIKVNGQLLSSFVRLDAILDASVGSQVQLLIQRGGVDLELVLDVNDLHAITPDRFVTVAGGSFHNLSYQQARLYAIACKGLYVCEAAGSFKMENALSGWIIDQVDQKPTPDLDAFVDVIKAIPDKSRVPKTADFIQLDGVSQPAAADIVRSFVKVSCYMPVKIDGYPQARRTGFGLVIDADQGLVVVSRAIVPYDLCDITVTVADSVQVEGKVVFLHPLTNYAVIKYDRALVHAPVQTARLANEPIKQGAETTFVGFNQNHRVVVAKTTVTDITAVGIPANAAAPRYRAVNLDAITVDTGLSSQCSSGVLIGPDGLVQALWLTYMGERNQGSHRDTEYHLGLGVTMINPVVDQIRRGIIPKLRILNIESYVVQMAQCRIMGVSDEWIRKVAKANPARHQLFIVRKVDCAPATGPGDSQSLQEGDIILTLNGQLITRVSEFDIMYDQDYLDALVVRAGRELRLRVPTVSTEDLETRRAVIFCGAVLQKPHHAVRQQISKLHSEIYVSARSRGSPAYQYGLAPTNFITHVNGVKTLHLDDFVREVSKIEDNTYFRLRAMTFDNVPWVVTMKKNDHYFPMSEYIKDESSAKGWRQVSYNKRGVPKDEGAPLTADGMDEGGADASDGEAAPDSALFEVS
ncbi:hypothetical protein DV737_g5361, partial [Chaetothyriales sp. CBS 132003]